MPSLLPSAARSRQRSRRTCGGRIAPARGGGLEGGTRRVPLQRVKAWAGAAREMRELVGEKALAGSGQAREERHAPAGKLADLAGEPRVGVQHQARGVAGAQATQPGQTRIRPGGKGTPRPRSKSPNTNAEPARLNATLSGQRSRGSSDRTAS